MRSVVWDLIGLGRVGQHNKINCKKHSDGKIKLWWLETVFSNRKITFILQLFLSERPAMLSSFIWLFLPLSWSEAWCWHLRLSVAGDTLLAWYLILALRQWTFTITSQLIYTALLILTHTTRCLTTGYPSPPPNLHPWWVVTPGIARTLISRSPFASMANSLTIWSVGEDPNVPPF